MSSAVLANQPLARASTLQKLQGRRHDRSSRPSLQGVNPRLTGCKQTSSFYGSQLPIHNATGHKWRMAQWLENKAEIEVPVPLETCWVLWEDREQIPIWMPWIKSVKVQEDDPRLSKWTLSTHQFGRDWEFSWLARNLAPIKGQKIHWISEPGSASLPGVELSNKGQIRFRRKSPSSCVVTLTISYEVPEVLVPFANALTPLVEGIIQKDMVRFKDHALEVVKASANA